MRNDCLSQLEIFKYSTGMFSDNESAQIESHLNICGHCLANVDLLKKNLKQKLNPVQDYASSTFDVIMGKVGKQRESEEKNMSSGSLFDLKRVAVFIFLFLFGLIGFIFYNNRSSAIHITKAYNLDNVIINNKTNFSVRKHIKQGSLLATKDAALEIQLNDANVVLLMPFSELYIKDSTQITLVKGSLIGKKFKEGYNNKFRVDVDTFIVDVIGTKFFIAKNNQDDVSIMVQHGHLEVQDKNNKTNRYDLTDNSQMVFADKDVNVKKIEKTRPAFYSIHLSLDKKFSEQPLPIKLIHQLSKEQLFGKKAYNSVKQSFVLDPYNYKGKNLLEEGIDHWQYNGISSIETCQDSNDNQYIRLSYKITNYYGEAGIHYYKRNFDSKLRNINKGRKVAFSIKVKGDLKKNNHFFMGLWDRHSESAWINKNYDVVKGQNGWNTLIYKNIKADWEDSSSDKRKWENFNDISMILIGVYSENSESSNVLYFDDLKVITQKK